MASVFISYAREDSDFAGRVESRLAKAGHQASMDKTILRAGEVWRDKLDRTIKASEAMVVIMTPHARTSDYVAYEWAFALGARVPIVPLRLTAASFHPLLDERQHVDFSGRQEPWEDLLGHIEHRAEIGSTRTRALPAGTPPTIRRAAAALDSPDTEQQMAGLQSLADTDHPAARDALIQALNHPVKNIRVAAAIDYPDLQDPRILSGLMEATQSGDFLKQRYPEMRFNLRVLIERMGPPAVPILLDLLQSPNPLFRLHAADALGGLGEKRALAGLIDMLRDNDHDLRLRSARALGNIGDPAAAPHLVKALADDDENVRSATADALGKIGPNAVSELVTALEDDSVKVRTAAAQALGALKAHPAVTGLLEHLQTDSSDVRAAAALALGRIGDPAALNPLLEMFQDETAQPAKSGKAAARALGLLGDPAAADVLLDYLIRRQSQKGWRADDKDLDAAEALLKLKCVDAINLVGNVLASHMAGAQSFGMVRLLGSLGDAAVPALIDLLAHRNDPFQQACAKALKVIGTQEALTALDTWRGSQ
jgi:HEAT repeat protein